MNDNLHGFQVAKTPTGFGPQRPIPGRGRRGFRPISTRANSRRGSTFIIVLALLSLLVLIATALSLTSRLEVISASNYAEGIQSRMAAKVGLTAVGSRILPSSTSSSSIANPQRGSQKPGREGTPLMTPNQLDPRVFQSSLKVSLAEVWMQDASARINLNTADETTLSRLFQRAASLAGVHDGNPDALARSIVNLRQSQSTSTTGTQSPSSSSSSSTISGSDSGGAAAFHFPQTLQSVLKSLTIDYDAVDLRIPPIDQEQRLNSITELLKLPGASQSLVLAAAPYLTVFSSSVQTADLQGQSYDLVDINTADCQEIFNALQTVYLNSSKKTALFKQFAVNLADWRDADDVPSVYPGTDGAGAVLGIERAPFLTEIWPNSVDPEETQGAGQYIELYNPWKDWIDIAGWKIVISGQSYPLSGSLAPAGYLIATDCVDGLNRTPISNSPFDSFYSIFGLTGNGTTRRTLEVSGLFIPRTEGIHSIELRNVNNDLIDVFTYRISQVLEGVKISYQRKDPRIRVSHTASCTPFSPMPNVLPIMEVENASENEESYPPNRPMASPTEILKVFAGWGDPLTGEEAVAALPIPATPASPNKDIALLASNSAYLDARMVDIFTVQESTLQELLSGETIQSILSVQQSVQEVSRESAASSSQTSSTSNASLRVNSNAYRTKQIALLLQKLFTAADRSRLTRAVAENDMKTVSALASRTVLNRDPGTRLGAVNLNTASELVLGILPGLDENIASQWVYQRQQMQTLSSSQSILLFRRPSDLLADSAFWNASNSAQERVERWTNLLTVACFTTRSVYLDSRTAAAVSKPGSRPPTLSRALALVAFDRGEKEFVAWEQLP